MKPIEIIAPTKEEAIKKATKKFGLPEEALKLVKIDDSSGDMLDGASPLEVRVTFEINQDFLVNQARNLTVTMLELMGDLAEVRSQIVGNLIKIKVQTLDPSKLIGHRGTTLNAIQHLINRMVSRGSRDLPFVVIDVQNYRERRIRDIEAIARKSAQSVIKYQKKFVLEPMPPEDRKIIHNALKDFKGVRTYSLGNEGNRSVIVDLAGYDKDTGINLEEKEEG